MQFFYDDFSVPASMTAPNGCCYTESLFLNVLHAKVKPMFINPIDSRSLYNVVDYTLRSLQPFSDYCLTLAKQFNSVSDSMNLPVKLPYLSDEGKQSSKDILQQYTYLYRKMAGNLYTYHMVTSIYEKPEFDITEVKIGDSYCDIAEEIVSRKSFCNLLHFKKMQDKAKNYPKLLLVAPMSGHYATLLRGTVRDLLPFYDVYITDWKNARDVPLTEGAFDLDEYAQYMISFMQLLGPDLHVMAVCQPTVPVLVALAIMSTDNDPKTPKSVILLGGPIDTTQSPTAVNELATTRGDDWFKQNVISIVPSRYPGAMRLVYPGFMQLSGFMSMNFERHMRSLAQAIEDYSNHKRADAFKTVRFYSEYFSTMDITAEFYLQTINSVFQQKLLTKGRYKSRGREVRLHDIKNTSILAIEGGQDDITGVGQTKSVLSLCQNLPDSMKKYVLAEEVGHFGLFNGTKFRKIILPEIKAFTAAQNKSNTKKVTLKKPTTTKRVKKK